MNKTIQQLQQELRDAEKAMREGSGEKLLKEFQDALDGRYFTYCYDGHSSFSKYSNWVGAVRYYKIKLDQWRDADDDTRVHFRADRVYACLAPDKKTRGYGTQSGVMREARDESSVRLSDTTRGHIVEIDKKEFMRLWDSAVVVAAKLYEAWPTNPLKLLSSPEVVEPHPDIDVPHVALTPPEANMLDGSRFMLPDNHHLVSENARAFVKMKIQESDRRESSCSHLYESCDSGYLRNLHDIRGSLLMKFSLNEEFYEH